MNLLYAIAIGLFAFGAGMLANSGIGYVSGAAFLAGIYLSYKGATWQHAQKEREAIEANQRAYSHLRENRCV